MRKDVSDFKTKIKGAINRVAGKTIEEATERDIYKAIAIILKDSIGDNWINTKEKYKKQKVKQVYYISMEFLTGPFTEKNLYYLDVYDIAKQSLEELGFSIDRILDIEEDPGLGNGGLGRLAVAFLDSLACLSMPGHGYGLRYENGLFKQIIQDGNQFEEPDDWTKGVDMWQYRRDDIVYEVKFGGSVETFKVDGELKFKHIGYKSVKGEAYDIPILGYHNNIVNSLRLWKSESCSDIDFQEFSNGNMEKAYEEINKAKSITQFLYPNDSNYDGKKLRLKQEYFLVSTSIQDIIYNFKKLNIPLEDIADYVSIHTNDTHPALAIPEFMRILIDEEDIEWDTAWMITRKTFAFTNHTIMSEAMEKWDLNLYREVLPRMFLITEEINHRFMYFLRNIKKISSDEELNKLAIIWDNKVRMVNLSIIGSHSVNGVAALHTDILKERELNHFYKIFPERFNNKTNGIVHRKWLLSSNVELTELLTSIIGDSFKKNAIDLNGLLKYKNDKQILDKLYEIKHHNKQKLAASIFEEQGIVLNPYSIFDIQIKRIHEYKRQLLNILHVIYLYDNLRLNPNMDIVPRTFIFSGKAAPGYYIAKEIIRLINSVANLINNDLTIKDKIKVVFIPNYSVSKATEIIPAADVSEQISTTTKEASGTGNMKFMMNGAITLATLDGANVEISDEVGEDNIVIFGMLKDEVYEYHKNNNYNSKEIYYTNHTIKQTVDRLIDDKFFRDGETFGDLYNQLIKYNDQFFVLKDFEDYANAQKKIDTLYKDRYRWMEMSLVNIAKSGVFSSDITIKKYADEIWDIKSI